VTRSFICERALSVSNAKNATKMQSLPQPRAIMYREMSHSSARPMIAKQDSEKPKTQDEDEEDGDGDDIIRKRQQQLIRQLSSFLEAKDPKRLEAGGLVPLLQWSLVRSDRQVDDLLMEAYGEDLDSAGLRRLSFDQDEIAQWGEIPDGPAGRYARAASSAADEEIVKAEVRSTRISTHEAVVPVDPSSRRGSAVDTSGSARFASSNSVPEESIKDDEVPEPNF